MNQSLIATIEVLMRSPQTETRCQTFFILAGIQIYRILLLSTISGSLILIADVKMITGVKQY